ncbi:tRNA-dependent cyclodipeptide synthase [Streptomyces mangrovi]|uniref:tRNA-dependent cyclodipeptide synthase n=1 Tax=Streptomyces mangrovi TaxID=1206892 RepID=UPI00399C964C
MFEIEPLTENCRELLPEAAVACIGVSPFNSYFSTRRLTALAGWAMERFERVCFFVPDTVAAYTLEALGCEPGRARHKARSQGRYVHNKITTALRSLGVEEPRRLVLGMERLGGSARYGQLLAEAHLLFREDASFRAACLEASRWVLDRRLPPGAAPGEEQLRRAVRYFLAELPLFADSAGVTGVTGSTGDGSSFFLYHQRVVFLERFYRRELSWRPVPGQGFVVVRERAPEAGTAEAVPAAAPVGEVSHGAR